MYKTKRLKNGGNKMINTQAIERYCTVQESLIESIKEMNLMRQGKIPKRNLNDLWSDINECIKEAEDEE